VDLTIRSVTDRVDLGMDFSIYLRVSASDSKLSSYQDAECSSYSESYWYNFGPDVRAICERV
jgi:hypothetical protein